MSELDSLADRLGARLIELIAECSTPGAVLGVYSKGEFTERGAGVLNTRTGVEVTPDAVFQIGSITKVWTAALVMRLVEAGELDLDAPVRTYLPKFRLAEESAATSITTRQLLSHTAGFEGDIFTDTGPGDDSLAKFVDLLHDAPQVFEPGELFSYNNAGYCVLGLLVETLRGKPYLQCLREDLIQPLELTHTAVDAAEAILHRAAVGHFQPDPDQPPQPAGVWALPRSLAPAGSALTMSARDLLTFARALMSDDGVLGGESIRAMRTEQVRLPVLWGNEDAWGLGLRLTLVDGVTVCGHNGDTIGQHAFLRFVPERDLAVVLLTNGGEVAAMFEELFAETLRELADIEPPALPVPGSGRIDASRYLGSYGNALMTVTVSQDDDEAVWAELVYSGADGIAVPPQRFQLLPYDGDTLVTAQPQRGVHQPRAFVGADEHGRARFLHMGRALARLPETP